MRRKYLNAKFIIGALCLATIFALAILGNFITPHDAQEQDLLASLQPPSISAERYYLGTDHLGRDILARMVSGARVSLLIATAIVLISGVFGVLYGALSGYWGGIRDIALQKVVETFWAFPADPPGARDPRLLRPEPDQHHPGAVDPALDSVLPDRARAGAGAAQQGVRRCFASDGCRHNMGGLAHISYRTSSPPRS